MRTQLSGIWRRSDFVKLWTAQTISLAGSQMGALGLTALIHLHATPAQMGVLAAVSGAPVLLFSLLAGVWIDRLQRRPLLITADVGRAALLTTVPLAALFEELRIEQLFIVAFCVGVLELCFNLAYRSYLPSLLDRDQLVEGNSALEVSDSATEIGGPAVGAGLVQALSGPAAVAIDAFSFIGSALFVSRIRVRESTPDRATAGESAGREALEGFHAVRSSRYLAPLAAASSIFGFFGGFNYGLYGLWVIRELGLAPIVMGLLIGAGGVASLFGSLINSRLTRRLGLGRTLAISRLIMLPIGFLTPLAGGPTALAVAFLLAGQLGDVFWTTAEIGSMTLRQSVTPDRLLGRVNATLHMLRAGTIPVGALTAGFLAEAFGVRPTLFVAACGIGLGDLWLFFSPIRSFRLEDWHPENPLA